jgi:chromosomal replication initiator protein
VFAALLPAAPDARLTRATFLEGGSNRAAVAACDAAVRAPSAAHNPLYLHGPSGSGRSHLLAATANALRAARGGRAACVTASAFVDELAAALRANTVERWRARYAALDVLALDDLHALGGHARAEQELALLSAAMRERGRQLLLAGEADPADAERMGEPVRLEVVRGLAVAIGAPDTELRAQLVAARLAAAARPAGADLVAYLAERADPSAHAVAPLVQRVLSAADRAASPLTLALARAELGRTPALTPLASIAPGSRATGRLDAFFLDAEKVVLDWPDVSARAIEEFR